MKVGDMVGLSFTVTRKGYPHEKQVGLVIEIKQENDREIAVVNFCGVILEYSLSYLREINESG